jgi:Family of unknown function (DUF5908)
MPIEIRELVIRATVEEEPQAGGGKPSASATSGSSPGANATERAKLIAECVDQVMEVLREQRER